MNMEYKDSGAVEMLQYQDYAPYCASAGVEDVLRAYPMETTARMAQSMYITWLYIEGKRVERVKKKITQPAPPGKVRQHPNRAADQKGE